MRPLRTNFYTTGSLGFLRVRSRAVIFGRMSEVTCILSAIEQGDPRAERLFEVAQETKVYGRYCELLRKIGKIADQKVGKHLPVNVTGAIAAISLDMGIHWQMSKSFAILGRALGGLAHVGEEIRRPIARGISNLIRDNLQYEPEK